VASNDRPQKADVLAWGQRGLGVYILGMPWPQMQRCVGFYWNNCSIWRSLKIKRKCLLFRHLSLCDFVWAIKPFVKFLLNSVYLFFQKVVKKVKFHWNGFYQSHSTEGSKYISIYIFHIYCLIWMNFCIRDLHRGPAFVHGTTGAKGTVGAPP
jgi:hypothetical protein